MTALATVSAEPDAGAFVAGVVAGLVIFFTLLILLAGVAIVRRIVAA